MTRTAPILVPSPSFHTTAAGGHLETSWHAMGAIHAGSSCENRVSRLEPSGPETETLPLGHCGRLKWLNEKNQKNNNSEIKRKH
ncbi:hypothetical protein AVEN_178138-1 [Araneus ventricosus]|uniref:Uncharacterized protein n=1 Tax=Araneus ventricosus TaxID=182803 RepID=A0A4Y2GE44_ARAVE|nr:hypothetical protein AVEN_178138-1 [Araneus ventricosus]